ncbi:membrane protein [Bacteroidia bacterium]|nr:membrane protein [Bacteroidia bacterium]
MKKIKYLLLLPLAMALCVLSSCDEKAFLEEKSYIYDAATSLNTREQFQTSLNYLYNRARWIHSGTDNSNTELIWYLGTDFAFYGDLVGNTTTRQNGYKDYVVPTRGEYNEVWENLYKIIGNANMIISRLPDADKVTDADKKVIRGEALFLRAYAHRTLAHLWGDVPLITEEVTSPRRNYTRDKRADVYASVRDDLAEAATLLPNVETARDGQVNKQVAQHLLAEIYISLGENQKAVDEATKVIDHPALGLMTSRFGSLAANTYASVDGSTGDPYWDLFRVGNFDRGESDNKESLWVLQYGVNNAIPGSTNNSMQLRCNPQFENFQIMGTPNAGGSAAPVRAFYGTNGTTYYGTEFRGGRSYAHARPTHHFFEEIFDAADIRGGGLNILRDYQVENPDVQEYGKWIKKDGLYATKPLPTSNQAIDTLRVFFPAVTKLYQMFQYDPSFHYTGTPNTINGHRVLVRNNGWRSNKDQYVFRLAETYLLRAEAYLTIDKAKAAADINVLHSRANAPAVTATDMDIDYILDERLRELYYEELRAVTLCRLGKLYDRAKAYNEYTARTIEPYHNLWPIHHDVIERNNEVKWDNNPGY